jgi:very-short-patch-repair endonuclease
MQDFETFVKGFAYKKNNGSPPHPVPTPIVRHVAPVGKSEGERLVHRLLRELGYGYFTDYLVEHTFEELGKLRFDFFLRNPPLLIEFDGNQHYEGSRFHRTRTEWLESIERDEAKNRFCREKGISLLRIPQVYIRFPKKLKGLIADFIEKIHNSDVAIIEVDLYFQWKAGKLPL